MAHEQTIGLEFDGKEHIFSSVDPKTGKDVFLKCEFNNSTGKAKRQGARAVLQIWE